MREKPVHFEITDCARGTTLGLSLLPNCPRLSHISLRGLLPRRLLARHLAQPVNQGPRVLECCRQVILQIGRQLLPQACLFPDDEAL
jgi:hypothetical protein